VKADPKPVASDARNAWTRYFDFGAAPLAVRTRKAPPSRPTLTSVTPLQRGHVADWLPSFSVSRTDNFPQ
jgi:hypothetical protein